MASEISELLRKKRDLEERLKHEPKNPSLKYLLNQTNNQITQIKEQRLSNLADAEKKRVEDKNAGRGFSNLSNEEEKVNSTQKYRQRNLLKQAQRKAAAEKTMQSQPQANNQQQPQIIPNFYNPNQQQPEKPEKWKKTKFAGKVAIGAGKASWRAGKGLLGAVLSSGQKQEYTAKDAGSIDALYAAAIIIHAVDWGVFKFAITPTSIVSRTIFYMFLAVFAHYALKHETWGQSISKLKWLVLFPVLILPFGAQWITTMPYLSAYADKASAFILAVPIWLLYLNSVSKGIPLENQGPFMKLTKWYLRILLIFMIVSATILTSMNVAEIEVLQTTGMDPSIAYSTFKEWMITQINAIKDVFNTSVKEFNKKTLGFTYRGQTEQAQERTGFEISKFSTTQTKYIKGTAIRALATIDSRQIDDTSNVVLDCYMISTDRLKPEKVPGKIIIPGTDSNILTLTKYTPRKTVTCEVDTSQKNTGGVDIQGSRFQIVVEGNVDYSMSVTLRYYFVHDTFADEILGDRDKTLLPSLLGIPAMPESISSNGPMQLLASADIQRNPIVFNKGLADPVTFGMKIGQKTTNTQVYSGKIDHVNYVDYYLPEQFSNVECTPVSAYENRGKAEDPNFNIIRVVPTDKNVSEVIQMCTTVVDDFLAKDILPTGQDDPPMLDLTTLINTNYNYAFQKRSEPINLISVG